MARSAPRLAQAIFRTQMVTVIVVLGLISLLVHQLVSRDMERRAELLNASLALVAAERINALLNQPAERFSVLAQVFAADGSPAPRALSDLLDRQVAESALVDAAFLLDGDNRVVAAGLGSQRSALRQDYLGIQLSDRPFMARARSGQMRQWSGTFLSPFHDAPVVAFAQPLGGGYLFLVHLAIPRIEADIAALALRSQLSLAVVDGRGHVVAHTDDGITRQRLNISNEPLIAAALGGSAGTGMLAIGGQRLLASSVPLAGIGWHVVAGQPLAQVRKDLTELLWVLALVAVLALILALAVSRVVAERLARPIAELSEAAGQLASGNFDLGQPAGGFAEVRELGQRFRQMAAAIARQQSALRESELRYRTLVDEVPCVIARITPDERGTVRYVSRQIESLTGYPVAAFDAGLGLGLLELVEERDHALRAGLVSMRLAQDKPWRVEYRIRHRDGDLRWVLEQGRAVHDDQGKPQHLDLMLIDNTQTRLAERNRQEQVELMVTLLNTVSSPIYHKNAHGLFIGCNPAFERLVGIGRDELLGRESSQLAGRAPLLPLLEAEERSLRDRIGSAEAQISFGDEGERRLLLLSVASYPAAGGTGVGGLVGSIHDITERIQLQEVMAQSEKMLSLGGLAAGMAHEINNPLAGIVHNAQILANRLRAGLPVNEEVAARSGTDIAALERYMNERGVPRILAAIQESGERAARIVENMLSFSRVSNSDFVPCRPAELLEKTIELIRNDYELKKALDFSRLRIERSLDPELEIIASPQRLQQVFFNLLKNALQAMEQTPQPGLRLAVGRSGNSVRIVIEDNGPGVDPRHASRIFEPFYTTKEVGVGTGLGLSVSYFIITQHHRGTIRVEPGSDGGARFVIELPLRLPSG